MKCGLWAKAVRENPKIRSSANNRAKPYFNRRMGDLLSKDKQTPLKARIRALLVTLRTTRLLSKGYDEQCNPGSRVHAAFGQCASRMNHPAWVISFETRRLLASQRLREGTSATKRRPSSRHDAAPPCWSVEQATGNAPTVDQHWRHWPAPGRRRSGPGSTESVSLAFETRHVFRLCPQGYSGQARRGTQERNR